MRRCAEATSDIDAEAGFGVAVVEGPSGGDDANIVEHRLAAVGAAAREVHLELARQTLTQWVANEVTERGIGPSGDIEVFVRARTSEMAGHHVAHGVATRLAAGEPDCCELTHEFGNPSELNEVDLHVLAGGDVTPAAREVLGEVAHHVHLLGRDGACGQLDAHHLIGAALALAVDAIVEAHHSKDVFANLAGKVLRNGLFEANNVALLLGVEVTRFGNYWGDAHGRPPGKRGTETNIGLNPTNSVNNRPARTVPQRSHQHYPAKSTTWVFSNFLERVVNCASQAARQMRRQMGDEPLARQANLFNGEHHPRFGVVVVVTNRNRPRKPGGIFIACGSIGLRKGVVVNRTSHGVQHVTPYPVKWAKSGFGQRGAYHHVALRIPCPWRTHACSSASLVSRAISRRTPRSGGDADDPVISRAVLALAECIDH